MEDQNRDQFSFLLHLLYRLGEKLLVLAGVLGVLLPLTPRNLYYTSRDSGVFLYVGWRILKGELPYRDVWDHKPPVIFYLDALGLGLTGGSRWGVWLVEFVALLIAAFVGYKIVRKFFGVFPAVLGTFLWLLTLVFVIHGGNLTTEYTLPLQFVALWLAQGAFRDTPFSLWRWFAIGFLGGIAFFTKQTAVGVWVAMALFLIVWRGKHHQVKRLLTESLFFLGGFVAVVAFWVAFFALQGSVGAFWSAAFEYNFVYASVSLSRRLHALLKGPAPLAAVGLLPLAEIGYGIGGLLLIYQREMVRDALPLIGIGLLDFPIEFVLASLSGRTYDHYYMVTLPVLYLFASLTFWVLLVFLGKISTLVPPLFVLSVGGMFLISSLHLYRGYARWFDYVNQQRPVVETIKLKTSPGDKILLWGAETTINFFTQRVSPSRFVYQYPLYTKGHVTEEMVVEFLDDLIRHPPRLIIDTHNPLTPLYKFPIRTPAIKRRLAFLRTHYCEVRNFFPVDVQWAQNWTVYEYKADGCLP